MGRVEQIWVKRSAGGVMDARDTATVRTDGGIVGNADFGGTRQVTLLSADRWATVQRELGTAVDPVLRRANVLVSGVDLVDSRGKTLRIGDVRLEIRGETRPCTLMEDAHPGLQAALDADWGGGAYARVLDDGEIRVGDAVRFS